jgi:site-specific DNA-methyltransferase (adenine-specific)
LTALPHPLRREEVSLQLIHGDCLEEMKKIPDGSIDLVLTDPPYGTTACKWDSIIPLEPMWKQLKRIIKPNGAIVLTASQPFTSKLISSNMKMFKYEWIWEKEQGVNFLCANIQPLKVHENIVVFYNKQPTYNPQKTKGEWYKSGKGKSGDVTNNVIKKQTESGERNPRSIIKKNRTTGLHPTQKPVALMEYFIKTYTNEGDTVLDFAAGSFTTLVACIKTNRKGIGIEKEIKYYNIGKDRIKKELAQGDFFRTVDYG